jgi:hypothetical protein
VITMHASPQPITVIYSRSLVKQTSILQVKSKSQTCYTIEYHKINGSTKDGMHCDQIPTPISYNTVEISVGICVQELLNGTAHYKKNKCWKIHQIGVLHQVSFTNIYTAER